MELPDLLPKIQYEKYKMIQRAQENGGLSHCAANTMLCRVAALNNIPHTDTSPILYAHMDMPELARAKNWISSTVEFVNSENYGIGRLGLDEYGTKDQRIPRPIHGTPANGSIGWLAQRDIMTLGDLTTTNATDLTSTWLPIEFSESEPRWWEPLKNQPPPTGPLTLRRGHILLWPIANLAFEYLGQAYTDQQCVNLRQWNRIDNEPIQCGDIITTTEPYQGVAGIRFIASDNHSLQRAKRITYEQVRPGILRVTSISQQTT